MKRPAFMFYPADWRKDPELRVCSVAARGLWIDMLALMHEGEPYGHLVVNGVAVSDAQLARLVGESVSLVRRLLAELESHNVFSRNDSGVIYSRRMVRDEHIREVRAASGKLGGNPALMDKGKVKQTAKQSTKQKPTPSVAVAVSVADSPEKPLPPNTAAASVIVITEPPFALAPYLAAHEQRFPGATIPAARFGRVLKGLERKHGPAESLRRWKIFLAAKGELGPEYFARTWSEWGGAPRVAAASTAPADEEAWSAALDVVARMTRREITAETFQEIPVAVRAGLKALGGWTAVRDMKPGDLPFRRKDFLAAYRAAELAGAA